MIAFIVGALVGASAAIAILGFLTILADERDRADQERANREQGRRALREIEEHYRDYY